MADYVFGNSQVINQSSILPLFREYAWDFESDEFVIDGNGRMILLEGNNALRVWIYKALKTERFMYLAYTHGFGIELYPFIARVIGVNQRKSELKRMITEALMVNPYILSIDSITFEAGDNARELHCQIVLSTIYGELTI